MYARYGTGGLTMDDLIKRSDVIGLFEDMLLFGEYDIIASSFSKADEEKVYQAINEIPTINLWIPCSERFPDEAGEYLVCGRWDGEKSKTWICKFEIFVDIGGFVNSAKNPPISFWMPMPDAYKPYENE